MPDIDIGNATLHYEVAGTGEPILLIPGLGIDHSYYRFGIPLLSRHLQVLAVDPRGIGRSTKSPPPYSVESWADDFAAMIERLGHGTDARARLLARRRDGAGARAAPSRKPCARSSWSAASASSIARPSSISGCACG